MSINLHLRAKHFIRTSYLTNDNCAISKAAKEMFPNAVEISEIPIPLRVDDIKYKHECYSHKDFIADKKQAYGLLDQNEDPNTIIRTIVLEQV